jgi:hypothetical protein
MIHCKDCKYWMKPTTHIGNHGLPRYGYYRCDADNEDLVLPAALSVTLSANEVKGATLYTKADFGCVLGEAKLVPE